jgi:hypothetical protein
LKPAEDRPVTVELLPEGERERIEPGGGVSSAQEAVLHADPGVIEALWAPPGLERLARSYWRYLARVSLGLLRVVYEERARTVVLGTRRLALLRFSAPEYESAPEAAAVTWRIDRGVLVAAEGRGRGGLRIALRRLEGETGRVRVRVEVRNFYPWLRGRGRFARVGARLYSATQVRIHRRITFGFLRSLATLEVGRGGA